MVLQCSPSQDVVQGRHGNVPGDTPHSACGSHTWKALSLTYWHCNSDKSWRKKPKLTHDTLSRGAPCISSCTGSHIWWCNGSCNMACIPVKSPVFSWNCLKTCLLFNNYRLTLFIVLCCIVRVALWDVRSMALGKMVVKKVFVSQCNLLKDIEIPSSPLDGILCHEQSHIQYGTCKLF